MSFCFLNNFQVKYQIEEQYLRIEEQKPDSGKNYLFEKEYSFSNRVNKFYLYLQKNYRKINQLVKIFNEYYIYYY